MNLEELDKYSLNQLYEVFESSFDDDSLGAMPENDKEKIERGHSRFLSILRRIKHQLCESKSFQELLQNKEKYKKLEAAAVISDILVSVTGMATLSIFTFSLILISYGLGEICS